MAQGDEPRGHAAAWPGREGLRHDEAALPLPSGPLARSRAQPRPALAPVCGDEPAPRRPAACLTGGQSVPGRRSGTPAPLNRDIHEALAKPPPLGNLASGSQSCLSRQSPSGSHEVDMADAACLSQRLERDGGRVAAAVLEPVQTLLAEAGSLLHLLLGPIFPRIDRSFALRVDHAASRMRRRSRSKPARPCIVRFSILARVIWLSACPLLQRRC